MEKLFAMQVAAQLTQAACAGLGGTARTVDPTLQDQTQRAINLEVWETFRAYYNGVTQALADTSSWPSPKITPGEVLPGILQNGLAGAAETLLPLLTKVIGTGPLANLLPLITQFLTPTAPQQPIVKATGNLPDPGASNIKA